ncbi:tat pathway signal sequence [Colletotrichum asianum]
MVQPGPVCSVTALDSWVLTPSMMSISPELGLPRPDAAAARGHVRNVGDKQTRVVRLVGRDAHRLAALTGSLGVDAEVDAVLREAGEALVVGRLRAGVRLRALGRVGLVEEAELVEEVGLVVVVVEDVLLRLGQPGAEEGGGAQDTLDLLRRHRDLCNVEEGERKKES